tara:strand:- start:413 stop:646 length:234 start_codon:yes stop_codon:yes gene_type:complete
MAVVDNYKAFEGLNFSNARSENESFEDYKTRLKQNEQTIKLYRQVGRDVFKAMFPNGIAEAFKQDKKISQEKLGEAK